MRVLLIYPGPRYSTYDVARGWEGALRAYEGVECVSYAYHTAAAFYELFWGAIARDNERLREELANWKALPTVFAAERTAIAALDAAPDWVLIVSGTQLHRRAFELLERMGCRVAMILTESPYMDAYQRTVLEKGNVRVAFTNDRASVPYLLGARRKSDGKGLRVVYLPHSFDPEQHRRMCVEAEYKCDVFFYGSLWPERKQLFGEAGLMAPPEVRGEGSGWEVRVGGVEPDLERRGLLLGEPMDNAEMVQWYNGAKIVLNPQRRVRSEGGEILAGEAWSLGPRAFEVAACGGFQLVDEGRGELEEVFGDSVATFRAGDAWDLRQKIAYYLEHEAERREVAAEAHRRVWGVTDDGCRFSDRAREIVVPVLEEEMGGRSDKRC
jgi:spore maturation protein CgeB